jgi:hypothetical protein
VPQALSPALTYFLSTLLPLILFLQNAAAAPSPAALEYQLKAAFLLKFTLFVEWPDADNRAPFPVCVLGDDPFGPALDQTVEGETVNSRKIVIRRIHRDSIAGCGVLYVSPQEKNPAEALAAAGPGVLTVGEGDAFLDQGGMIAFVLDNRRVRFDADPAAARKAGLKLSSRLLNVARIVR